MIMLESQRLTWGLLARVAAGDYAGAAQAWNTAGDAQRRQAALILTEGTRLLRMLAVMQAGHMAPFRGSDIPASLCAEGRRYAEAYHRSAPAYPWPGCDCQLDLAVMIIELHLRQGEALGFSRTEQGALITRGLGAADLTAGHESMFAAAGNGYAAAERAVPAPMP
jgi:hypothetical protein